jgi:cytochrome c
MKKMGTIICLLMAAASLGIAGEQPSITRGQALFTGTQLGTNGMSCATCHPGGAKLGDAAGYQDDELTGIIKQCISKPLQGDPFAVDATDLKSLIMYIRSLAPPSKP